MTPKSVRMLAAGAALAMLAVLPACFPESPNEGPTACESVGGTFALGTGNVVWTCTNLQTILEPEPFELRYEGLEHACEDDGGTRLDQPVSPEPQDATCLQ